MCVCVVCVGNYVHTFEIYGEGNGEREREALKNWLP